MVHELKCWTEVFHSVYIGEKEFEIRVNDRDFKVGDSLHLREWDPITKTYTGKYAIKRITYTVQGKYGLPENLCVMQLR
jgi:hypothetical protein